MLTTSTKVLVSDEDNVVSKCQSCEPSDDFSGIVVNDSSNIHIGPRHIYNGNVLIQQYANPFVGENCVDLGEKRCEVINRVRQLDVREGVISYTNGKTKAQCFAWKVFWLMLVCMVLVGSGAAYFFYTGVHSEDVYVGNMFENETDYNNLTTAKALKIVSRAEWLAAPSTSPFLPQKLPMTRVVVGHTVTNLCSTTSACSDTVRCVQAQQLSSFGDIAYNFLVGGDGNAYFGLGWDLVGTHTYGYNTRSLGLAFIGTFTEVTPNTAQMEAALKLIEVGVLLGKISADYKVYAQCQLTQSLSPGKYLYEKILYWPHFDNTTECIF